MWLEARHQRIQSLLERLDRITTDQVVEALGVSRETVRRDFLELEAQGMLKRVHGGAVRIQPEAPIDKRIATRVKYKQRIARSVAQHLDRAATVFMDAGSTTTILARELAGLSDLTIITNSLDAALKFREAEEKSNSRLVLLGGDLSHRLSATAGSVTVAEIARYNADYALLSPVAIDAARGATSFDHDEAAIAQAMVRNARKVLILADYSKIGLSSRISYCASSKVEMLFTNAQAVEQKGYEALAAKVGEVVLV